MSFSPSSCVNGSVDDQISVMEGAAALPRQNGELVFHAPWESRAFGLVVALHEAGLFEWEEFQTRLIRSLQLAETRDEDTPWNYYEHWLNAFERLALDKGWGSKSDLARCLEEIQLQAEHDDHQGDSHEH